MIGLLYFFVIILANSIGAVSGMGGGVIIKPVFDLIGAHSVASISFYSTIAVFTMSISSTLKQLKSGQVFDMGTIFWISGGAVLGGILGNFSFERLLANLGSEKQVTMIQILLTIITLVFTFLYSKYEWRSYTFRAPIFYFVCGLLLGFLASLLGIGGGPINVSVLMLLFGFPIKKATSYSICTIFFSQLAKLVSIAVGSGFLQYDLTMLYFIIPAAILGGIFGAKLSQLLPSKKVAFIFQSVILLVLGINLFNFIQLL
ncbi:sulfite exporter TauE/SafE family protein [Enterococcus sp. AZ196]|uniref:sulfite exporter TauE/SafE family protein n=1 Tax=Enterococcus sp. AZ196 TaxID=2774659 RepID=UPI003D2E0AFE